MSSKPIVNATNRSAGSIKNEVDDSDEPRGSEKTESRWPSPKVLDNKVKVIAEPVKNVNSVRSSESCSKGAEQASAPFDDRASDCTQILLAISSLGKQLQSLQEDVRLLKQSKEQLATRDQVERGEGSLRLEIQELRRPLEENSKLQAQTAKEVTEVSQRVEDFQFDFQKFSNEIASHLEEVIQTAWKKTELASAKPDTVPYKIPKIMPEPICSLCQKPHLEFVCTTFIFGDSRRSRLIEQKRCTRCGSDASAGGHQCDPDLKPCSYCVWIWKQQNQLESAFHVPYTCGFKFPITKPRAPAHAPRHGGEWSGSNQSSVNQRCEEPSRRRGGRSRAPKRPFLLPTPDHID